MKKLKQAYYCSIAVLLINGLFIILLYLVDKNHTLFSIANLILMMILSLNLVIVWLVYKMIKSYKEDLANTERSKLIHNAKLASLGAMSAGVVHEINNPLAVISSILPFLRKTDVDPGKLIEKLDAIDRAVDKIKKITKGLTKFTRSTANREYSLHKIQNIILESRDISIIKAKRSYVDIDLEIHTDASILCDEVEIEQVLVNLMNNAVDAVADLQEKWIKICAFDKGDMAVVQVINSGPIIPDDVANKIFLPFFTTKPVGEGTGLGLSICKNILDQHNASFFLNRELQNTCFEIQFKKELSTNLE